MITPVLSKGFVTYIYHDDTQVHEFAFKKSSRQTIDEWVVVMDELYKGLKDTDEVKFIFDFTTSGAMPLNYAFTKAREWSNSLEVHPQAMLACIYPNDTFRPIINSFFKLVRLDHITMRFFSPNMKDEAFKWLIE